MSTNHPPRPLNGLGASSSRGFPVDEASRAKMDVFRKIKPTCVTLMSLSSVSVTPSSPHTALLATLYRDIAPLPSAAFTGGMINYVLLPITQLLRASDPAALPDNFLEAAFRLLELLVQAWRRSPEGIDVRAWEQLWRFVVATVMPRGAVDPRAKGKGRELGQEAIYEATRLLDALLGPEGLQEEYTTSQMKQSWSTPKAPLMPSLFQTITFLLSQISPKPPNLPLQLLSLRLLATLTGFLHGQQPVLASVLPGVISSISKLYSEEGKSIKGDAAASSAELVQRVIVMTLNDEDMRSLGVLRPIVDDLSQLAELDPLPPDSPVPPSPSPSISSTSSKIDPFPPLSASYLAFTSSQLFTAVPPILTLLASHHSHLAQLASIQLASDLISKCTESLPDLVPPALRILLTLSLNPFDEVRHSAAKALRSILEMRPMDMPLMNLLSSAINALPRLIMSRQESQVVDLATMTTAIAEITSYTARFNPIADLLGPSGKVERWSWSILNCLEFGRPQGWSAPSSASKTAELGWMSGFATVLPLIDNGDTNGDVPMAHDYPELPLRYLESPRAMKAMSRMLVALGSSAGEAGLHAVDFLLHFAQGHAGASVSKAVSAVWVAEKLLQGIAEGQLQGADGKVGRRTRKFSREAVRILMAIDENEAEDDVAQAPEESSDLVQVSHEKGINDLTTLLDRPIPDGFAAEETRRLHVAAQRALLTCNSLRLIALSSRILSSGFRPLLLNVLYMVLSHLASAQPLIREHAEITLSAIAYHTNYASPANLILDNVDYIVNVVSLRLTRNHLSPQAPLVLIAMIRLVGGEIVPMVHDVVDEIFDALDDYHGYEALTAGLLAVLSVLVEVMRAEVDAEGMSEERKQHRAEMNMIDPPPDPAADFTKLQQWWTDRSKLRQEEMDSILDRAPAHAWGKGEIPKDDATEDPPNTNADEEVPPTRTQAVCIQILEKSTFFLTHKSAFLRSRILLLIRDAIPVLAAGNRESDLLPMVDKAWGTILYRLDDTEPYVVEAAAEVVESLAEHVGDFMSKRILDHAWPHFRRLLKSQQIRDSKSALARRNGVGTEGRYTASHRFHAAVLRCIRWVAEEVPISEDLLWEMMLAFRPFLDVRVHEELQALAVVLYRALGRRDGDSLWVALSATTGTLEGDTVWDHLHDKSLDIQANVELLVEI